MYWIEIRCANRCEDNGNCWSHENCGPMYGSAKDTQKSVKEVVRELAKEAVDSGWKKQKDEWVCPSCVDHLKNS